METFADPWLTPDARTALLVFLGTFATNLALTAYYHIMCSHPPMYHFASAVDLVGISFPAISIASMVGGLARIVPFFIVATFRTVAHAGRL
jgi:hypothetical protein